MNYEKCTYKDAANATGYAAGYAAFVLADPPNITASDRARDGLSRTGSQSAGSQIKWFLAGSSITAIAAIAFFAGVKSGRLLDAATVRNLTEENRTLELEKDEDRRRREAALKCVTDFLD